MANRKAVSKKIRFEILKRDKFTCRYCGAKAPGVLLHIEHINPVVNGGTNDIENLLASCEECNQGKGKILLSNHDVVEHSRDELAKAQAEIDQLEEMISWRELITKKKSLQNQIIIESLEQIAGIEFSEYGVSNVLKGVDKFGYDKVAEHIEAYLKNCDDRQEKELKQYTFLQFIKFQDTRYTIIGRKNYLKGIVRNRTSFGALGSISKWLESQDSLEYINRLIYSLISFMPDSPYIREDDFIEWWHEEVRNEYGRCCKFHCGEVVDDE